MKQPKVATVKLGRQRAFGQAWHDFNLIEIDPRQSAKELQNTLIHEFLHIKFPDWSERQVNSLANDLSKFMWKNNSRIIMK